MSIRYLNISNNIHVGAGVAIKNVDAALFYDSSIVNELCFDCAAGFDFAYGQLLDFVMLNNSLHGNGSAGTGIEVGNFNTGSIMNNNNVYGYDTLRDITGLTSPGSDEKSEDPLFVDAPDDFTVGYDSPCLDAGLRTGYEAFVPAVDFLGNDRPVDQPFLNNVDDGTDIGAYETAVLSAPVVQTQLRPVEIETLYTKFQRVTRQIADIDNFIMKPGMWAILDDAGKLITPADYASALAVMMINYVNQSIYDSHDTRVGRVSCIESFGVKIRINNDVYVGQPINNDLLTVSAETDDEGKLVEISSLGSGTYWAFAKVLISQAPSGWIEFQTISPRQVVIS